jgi:hypothetical protein
MARSWLLDWCRFLGRRRRCDAAGLLDVREAPRHEVADDEGAALGRFEGHSCRFGGDAANDNTPSRADVPIGGSIATICTCKSRGQSGACRPCLAPAGGDPIATVRRLSRRPTYGLMRRSKMPDRIGIVHRADGSVKPLPCTVVLSCFHSRWRGGHETPRRYFPKLHNNRHLMLASLPDGSIPDPWPGQV